jgi:predicted SprT family Zn-dependent metalloprotease
MRMLLPQLSLRREIDRNLVLFFRQHRLSAFNRAISRFCRFYNVRRPRIEWYASIDWGKTAGKTYEDGRIHLLHPLHWKRARIYNRERMWVQTVYHELGHYLLWTDPEHKADTFSRRMVRGLRRVVSRSVAKSAQRGKSLIRTDLLAKTRHGKPLVKIRHSNKQARA